LRSISTGFKKFKSYRFAYSFVFFVFFLFAKHFCKKNDHRQLYFFLEILNHYILGAKIFIIIDRHIYGIRAYKWQIGTDVDQAKVQLKIVEGKIGEDYVALDSNKMMSYKNCILWLFSKF